MPTLNDLTGKKFGRWNVKSFAFRKDFGKYHYQIWNCICDCGTQKDIDGSSLKKGTSVSCGCFAKENRPKGKDCYQWKENNLGYWGIHQWLRKHFGSANKCEADVVGLICERKSKTFNWSKLKAKGYERKRENFIQLCRGCHNRYDMTEETKRKLSVSVKIAKAKIKND